MGRRTSESKRKKIEAEILAALERLIAGCGALDMGAAFGPFSRSSEFRMIGADGALCDFATFCRNNVSYLETCSAFSVSTIAADVLVLRSDLAVLSWVYRAEATLAGGERDVIERVCARVDNGDVLVVANLNAPDQIVISGHRRAIDRAEPVLRRAGARRVVRLRVASAFHTPLMRPAADRLAELLADVSIRHPRVPVLSNATGKPHASEPDSIRRALVAQLVGPVRWETCMRWTIDQGVTSFVEILPGGVLCGLARRIDDAVRAVCVDDAGVLPAPERT